MKPRISLLVPLAALLLAGACKNNPTHWDHDDAPERASYHFLGANGYTPASITETSRGNSQEMVLLMRRHFFNDNPGNPLQKHRENTFGRYVPIWDMPVNAVLDTADLVAYGAVRAAEGVWASILLVPQVLIGTSDHESYREPPRPEEFRVRNTD
jgi:hypothetical protein